MAKRKFIEKRRRERTAELGAVIEPREYRATLESLLAELKVGFETHWSEDEHDNYYGFKLSYDPASDRTWYVIQNPFGGADLELAIENSFDLMFGGGCWSFHPTESEYCRFCATIKAIVDGYGANVKICVGDATKACAVLVGDELCADNEFALMDRVAEKDWYKTNRDIDYFVDVNKVEQLKKELRRLHSRNACHAEFEYFNPVNNKSLEFGTIHMSNK